MSEKVCQICAAVLSLSANTPVGRAHMCPPPFVRGLSNKYRNSTGKKSQLHRHRRPLLHRTQHRMWMLTSLLDTLYFSAMRLATALAPRNSEFQLCDEDACFFNCFSFRALKSVEAVTKSTSVLENAGIYSARLLEH